MSIKAGDLRRALAKVPDDRLIILAIDEEGNGFNPLQEIGTYYYSPSVGNCVMLDELEEYGQDDSVLALCLWP